ncbi:MAG: hypothetical protein AB7N76_04715 [Planctomycetota bacterium]
MRKTALTLCLTTLALAAGAACQAGIVVLKRGDVIVGKVAHDPPREGKLVMRWPYGSRLDDGHMDIPVEEVRWYDAKSDVLTDAYFQDHVKEPLRGAVWLRQREEYLIRQRGTPVDDPGIPVPIPSLNLDPLGIEAQPIPGAGHTLRMPRGWTGSVERDDQGTHEVLVLEAPKDEARGYRPRVHAFAVETAPDAGLREQADWVEQELRRLKVGGDFSLRAPISFKERPDGGAEARLLTETRRKQRTIVALRRIAFRGGRTIVIAGYVDARDLAAFRGLLESCLDSLAPAPAN